jgi:hypothetical protein
MTTEQDSKPADATQDAALTQTTFAASGDRSETVPSNDFDALPDWAKENFRELRKENASHRVENRDMKSKLSQFEQAQMSEIERANETAKKASERAAALEAKLLIREATAALERANVIDAELALLAIRDKIVVTDGEPTNLDDLIADLVKAKPHLVKPTAPEKPIVPDTRPTSPAAKQDAPTRPRVWGKI